MGGFPASPLTFSRKWLHEKDAQLHSCTASLLSTKLEATAKASAGRIRKKTSG